MPAVPAPKSGPGQTVNRKQDIQVQGLIVKLENGLDIGSFLFCLEVIFLSRKLAAFLSSCDQLVYHLCLGLDLRVEGTQESDKNMIEW